MIIIIMMLQKTQTKGEGGPCFFSLLFSKKMHPRISGKIQNKFYFPFSVHIQVYNNKRLVFCTFNSFDSFFAIKHNIINVNPFR